MRKYTRDWFRFDYGAINNRLNFKKREITYEGFRVHRRENSTR